MVVESRKVIKVFIGSPGDLNKERTLFPGIVAEVNRIKANSTGIQLEPVGWEDTLPGRGRPQELIDEDVKQADLIIMLLWKRWGSPTGKYTSGFEEEYELAKSLNEKTNGKPEIWLYFRAVPEDMLVDPGEQLRQVLDFRNKIETEKKFLYRAYEDEKQWEKMLREYICRWLDKVNLPKNPYQEVPQQQLAEKASQWYEKSCEGCGVRMSVHIDWDNPPKYCKQCKDRKAAE